jgi:hypothetical protein
MKTLLAIPNPTTASRRSRGSAGVLSVPESGVPLSRSRGAVKAKPIPWMKSFVTISHLRLETRRIKQLIDLEFRTVLETPCE